MSDEVWLLLIGAAMGLVASTVGAVINHLLTLRAEKKKREWDRQEKESERLRGELLKGSDRVLDKTAEGLFIHGNVNVQGDVVTGHKRSAEEAEGQEDEADEPSD